MLLQVSKKPDPLVWQQILNKLVGHHVYVALVELHCIPAAQKRYMGVTLHSIDECCVWDPANNSRLCERL